jgi:hypothetical protein
MALLALIVPSKVHSIFPTDKGVFGTQLGFILQGKLRLHRLWNLKLNGHNRRESLFFSSYNGTLCTW